MKKISQFLFLSILLTTQIGITATTEEGFFVLDKKWLKEISVRPELIIDHVSQKGFEVYGPQGLGKWLQKNSIPHANLEKISAFAKDSYPTPEQVAATLKTLADKYKDLAHLFSIGKSTKGRDLWVMKIAKNVMVNDSRPEFKYIANMHGDEIVGRELMTRLIQDLLENYGKDPRITNLLDTTQIYIMPSMNPDGAAAGTRGNANYTDLNRNFPDFTTKDNVDSPEGRAPETQAVMRWQYTRKFILSANFHGGAEVVNYPWDTKPGAHPVETLVKNLSLDYAKLAPYIFRSTAFENGITNGYDWYEVNGGMQDWSWYWHRDLQLTVELSDDKWPDYKSVDYYYAQNRLALIDYIEKIHSVR